MELLVGRTATTYDVIPRTGAVVSTTLTFPLDVVKTRLQSDIYYFPIQGRDITKAHFGTAELVRYAINSPLQHRYFLMFPYLHLLEGFIETKVGGPSSKALLPTYGVSYLKPRLGFTPMEIPNASLPRRSTTVTNRQWFISMPHLYPGSLPKLSQIHFGSSRLGFSLTRSV